MPVGGVSGSDTAIRGALLSGLRIANDSVKRRYEGLTNRTISLYKRIAHARSPDLRFARGSRPNCGGAQMLQVEVRDTSLFGIAGVVEQLPDSSAWQKDPEIRLVFSDRYVYRTGLVSLATWRKALPGQVAVTVDDSHCQPATQRLIINSGFRELVEENREAPSSYSANRVPIQPLIRGVSADRPSRTYYTPLRGPSVGSTPGLSACC